jgi:hypothetical protein
MATHTHDHGGHTHQADELELGKGASMLSMVALVVGVLGLVAAVGVSLPLGGTGGGMRRFLFS